MALAAFQCLKCTGTNAGTENATDKDIYFLSSDLHSTSPASYPVRVPAVGVGTNYSFETALRWKLTTAPDNYVENVSFWGPDHQPDYEASPANKLTIYVGSSASGVTPIDTQSTIASTRQDTNYYSSGTALNFHSGQLQDVNDKSNYLYLQLRIAEQAQQGNMTTQIGNLSWDEA